MTPLIAETLHCMEADARLEFNMALKPVLSDALRNFGSMIILDWGIDWARVKDMKVNSEACLRGGCVIGDVRVRCGHRHLGCDGALELRLRGSVN